MLLYVADCYCYVTVTLLQTVMLLLLYRLCYRLSMLCYSMLQTVMLLLLYVTDFYCCYFYSMLQTVSVTMLQTVTVMLLLLCYRLLLVVGFVVGVYVPWSYSSRHRGQKRPPGGRSWRTAGEDGRWVCCKDIDQCWQYFHELCQIAVADACGMLRIRYASLLCRITLSVLHCRILRHSTWVNRFLVSEGT